MINYTKATTKEELEQILQLQQKNLFENLSEEERITQGFVTVKHSLEVLQKMNAVCAHTIAKYNNKVVGYALSMAKDFAEDILALKPMFLELNNLISDENFIVMGQVCVDKNYRKQGVFKALYHFMKTVICTSRYDYIITEIAINNERSLKAHETVGFINLKEYQHKNKNWRIVCLKV